MLSKILQIFLIPTVLIWLLTLVGFIFLLGQKRGKIGKICLLAGIIFYYAFSITPVANLILAPLENQYSPLNEKSFDQANKIVFLLGGQENSILRASEVFRIYAAKSQVPNPELMIIISGGSIMNINEAQEIKNFLIERGITKEKIILEDKSLNTFESVEKIKKIIQEKPFFLVTSAYHMPRAMETFQKMGINSLPAPTDFKVDKKSGYNLFNLFPGANNLKNVDLAFHEYFGILFYRIFRF